MDCIQEFGANLIQNIQQIHGPVLDSIFRHVTFLGDELFFLILLSVIFWSVNFHLGVEIAVILSLSGFLQTSLKDLLKQPRPFEVDSRVLNLDSADGYGLPSGHTQNATVVWGGIAARAKRFWLCVVAGTVIFLVGFSRVYLGAHFPTDVLAGWLIGIALVVLYIKARVSLGKKLVKLHIGFQLAMALTLPIILLLAHPVKDNAGSMGTLSGVWLGAALTNRYLHFKANGPWRRRILRLIIGLAIFMPFYLGLTKVLPSGEGDSALCLSSRFIRYTLLGILGAFGAPWLFRQVKLVT